MSKMTLVDDQGRKLDCNVDWVQRFVGDNVTDTLRPQRVLLHFRSKSESEDVFEFVWEKVMKHKCYWRKGKKKK